MAWIMDLWDELGSLKPGQAVFVTGFIGFLTLATGHSFNAWLARRRDDRLRVQERRGLLATYRAELHFVGTRILELTHIEKKDFEAGRDRLGINDLRDLVKVGPELHKRIVLLDAPLIEKIMETYRILELGDFGYEHVDHVEKTIKGRVTYIPMPSAEELKVRHNYRHFMMKKVAQTVAAIDRALKNSR